MPAQLVRTTSNAKSLINCVKVPTSTLLNLIAHQQGCNNILMLVADVRLVDVGG